MGGVFEKLKRLIAGKSPDKPEPQEPEEPSNEPVQRQLSDEGRVLRLLVKNDGQIRKSELLAETEWEENKAEEVLSEMEESDEIRIVPRGEHTLVCRPGYEPKGYQKI